MLRNISMALHDPTHCYRKTKVFLKYWHLDKLGELMDSLATQAVHMQRGQSLYQRFLSGSFHSWVVPGFSHLVVSIFLVV